MKRLLLASLLSLSAVGCVTLTEDEENQHPPQIHSQLSIGEIVNAGIKFGGETLQKSKVALRKKGKMTKSAAFVRLKIIENFQKWETHELVNSINIYQNLTPQKADEIFELLVGSDRPLAKELAWALAAGVPSKEMKAKIEGEITQYIEDDILSDQFNPHMAEAIANNKITNSYTVLRQGLIETHEPNFAEAMIYFDPQRASNDFLAYLAMANPEELRQITLASLNVMTCNVILEHLSKVKADINNPNFPAVFLFATSRNVALSESGLRAVQTHLPNNTQQIAMMLSRMPSWVQISFVNNASKNLLPITKNLLNDLKEISARSEVIYEIDSIKM